MTTVYDVPADLLIKRLSEELKKMKEIKPPDWAVYVKTGVHKQFAPTQENWWYTRVAAILRKVYLKGPIGIERLRAEFGGKRDRGSKKYHAKKGSGSIVRKALQQLEAAGLVRMKKEMNKNNKEVVVGREVTPKGRSFLDNLAHEIKKELVKNVPEIQKY
ncbi:MAG: 30S ribosomal protein S19e [Thermoplasmata archaeon]|nr:MAG: 30S ribosomal protein S19e [Thermoplasmata archaeon]